MKKWEKIYLIYLGIVGTLIIIAITGVLLTHEKGYMMYDDVKCNAWSESECGMNLYECSDGKEYRCMTNMKIEKIIENNRKEEYN